MKASPFTSIAVTGFDMSSEKTVSDATAAPAKDVQPVADERRRAALRQLGRGAVYAVPTTVGLMMMTRSARAS